MKFNVDYKVGDYFTGVLLETFKEARISRPRVRPIEMFAEDIRVEFPRALREDNPIGTKFRALVKVAQKTNKKTGKIIGDPYLVATDKTIDLANIYGAKVFKSEERNRGLEEQIQVLEEQVKVLEETKVSKKK